MHVRSFCAFLLAVAVLAFPVSACRHGGSPPCPDVNTSSLRTADGAPYGDLRVAAGAEGLEAEFRPADGGRYDGAYLITTSEGTFGYFPEIPGDARLTIPWEGLADDACGQSITVAIEALPDQAVALAVACSGGAPTAYATTTGGTNGGGNCPQ